MSVGSGKSDIPVHSSGGVLLPRNRERHREVPTEAELDDSREVLENPYSMYLDDNTHVAHRPSRIERVIVRPITLVVRICAGLIMLTLWLVIVGPIWLALLL